MRAARLYCWLWMLVGLLFAPAAGAATPIRPFPTAPPEVDHAPDPASVIREGSGYRYWQSGWIVVHIEGAPYERGYQHGKLMAAEIADHIQTLANTRSPRAPAEAWRDMRTLVNALFLRRYDAEYLEEMKGIADGAAAAGAKFDSRILDLIDIVALNSSIEVDFLDAALDATATGLEGQTFREPADGQMQNEEEEHCSAFAATGPATADGQIVFGHITMFHLYEVRHFNVWLDIKPKDGHRMVFQSYPGGIMSGLDYYMNDAGLLCSETTITQTHFNADGAPLAARIRRVLQYADSIDKAVEILLSSNNGLYANEWLFGDTKTNEIAMFELGTRQHKLWRSSKHEFPGGTEGFYWGCNNTKDLEVRKETVPSLSYKPANLVFAPAARDVTWQELFRASRGKIDAAFGFRAFTTPPLAAFRSCDAKFTTTALAKDLKSWALFGPPLGKSWDPTVEEVQRWSDIKPLVSNDWTMLHAKPPLESAGSLAKAVDLTPFPKAEKEDASRVVRPRSLPPAWHGTLLPESDGDIWLAGSFAEFERIVALEKSLKKKAKNGELDKAATDKLALAQFAPYSRWRSATRRLGRDLALSEVHPDYASNAWHSIAVGRGVGLLAALRTRLGADPFDKALDDFGRAYAAQPTSTAAFRDHLEKVSGHSLAEEFDPWISGKATPPGNDTNFWSIESFEVEPERALIVYGTVQDAAVQREAADLLERKIARRYTNFSVPIKSDQEVTEDDFKKHHLLLVGRPSANSVVERVLQNPGVRFGKDSFVLRGESYAHADSAVIVAAGNRLNDRYSVVVFAGLGARATRHVIESLPNRSGEPAEVMLLPAGLPAKMLRLSTPAVAVATP